MTIAPSRSSNAARRSNLTRAYHRFISPSGVGYDIGCGNLAAKTTLRASDVDAGARAENDWSRIAGAIQRSVSFGVGRNNDEPIADHPIFDRIARSPVQGQRDLWTLDRRRCCCRSTRRAVRITSRR
ncbi:MAG TPA: RtcB family protein [Vicinamibacterales bacterium]|nr:RtcB family protein [Vicinamibacterales bacterium]